MLCVQTGKRAREEKDEEETLLHFTRFACHALCWQRQAIVLAVPPAICPLAGGSVHLVGEYRSSRPECPEFIDRGVSTSHKAPGSRGSSLQPLQTLYYSTGTLLALADISSLVTLITPFSVQTLPSAHFWPGTKDLPNFL